MKVVKFKKWEGQLLLGRYSNGRPALRIVDMDTGEPIANVTVNLVDRNPKPGFVFIKDYFENEGMLKAMVDQGIVEHPTEFVAYDYVTIPMCKLLWKGE